MRMPYEATEAVRAELPRRSARSALPAACLAGRPTETRLLALQRAAGNAAVAQRMTHPVPVQRASLTIRPNDTAGGAAGTISGVSGWHSRPASNLRGSQGQHLTAYVVFKDTIKSAVVDRTPQAAAAALVAYLAELRTLPGMAKSTARNLDAYLDASEAALATAQTADAVTARAIVSAQIDQILNIRNQVPDTAQRGVGGGHGESNSAGIVRQVENVLRAGAEFPVGWGTKVAVADQVRHLMWRLLDYDPPSTEDPAKVTNALLTHYMSLRSAYPHTFNWLTVENHYLATYLAAHHGEAEMPLSRWAVVDLKPIFDNVHASL